MGILLSCKKCPLKRKRTEKCEATALHTHHTNRLAGESPNALCKQKGPISPSVFLLPPPPARRPSRASAGGQSTKSQAIMLRNQQNQPPSPYGGGGSGDVIYSVAHFHQQSVSLSPSLSPASLYSNFGHYENVRAGATIPAVYENVRHLPKPTSTVVFSSICRPYYTTD